MASSLVQIRLDDTLKTEATALYDRLGIDLPTAIRMFLKRSLLVNGVPFSMTLPVESGRASRAVRAMQEASAAAERAGVADMTPEEIDEEIRLAREEQA